MPEEQPTPPTPPASAVAPRLPGRIRRAAVRTYRLARAALACATLALIVLVLTPIPERLFDWLSVAKPPVKADAIVCLGGRYERLLWAADLYHRGFAPRIVVCNAPGAAQYMKRLLTTSCAVPPAGVLVDSTSYTTADHPPGVKGLGFDPQSQRFLIVTDHDHSRRAAGCFRKAGYTHVSIYSGPHPFRDREDSSQLFKARVLYLPRIFYEYTGLAQYWLQGKI